SAFDTVICDKPAPTAFIVKLPTLIFK
ncbi:DNA-binding transcriptional repressor DeoR, partial [Pasteurella multocida]|nr:DNA-binding transcriptional repressor DeoR [Pasteurella multocida]